MVEESKIYFLCWNQLRCKGRERKKAAVRMGWSLTWRYETAKDRKQNKAKE